MEDEKKQETQETEAPSVFQKKYDEFAEDLLGALPEYKEQILFAQSVPEKVRLNRFQAEIKFKNTIGGEAEEFRKNPGTVLPGVSISNAVWATLSDNTKKAIWEHVRVLSVCCFMEAGFGKEDKPKWMDDAMSAAMEDMKKKLESVDFQSLMKKFMNMMKPSTKDESAANAESATSDQSATDSKESDEKGFPNLDDMFKNGFPKLPERFLKGHMARLAQEMIKDITPADLGISPEMMKECEKDPSRSIQILFSTFTDNSYSSFQDFLGKGIVYFYDTQSNILVFASMETFLKYSSAVNAVITGNNLLLNAYLPNGLLNNKLP
jgi:hypothetical protein